MDGTIYWRNYSEAQLAAFQRLQAGNTCATNAIAACLNLACGCSLDGNQLGETAYQNWWRGWGNPLQTGIPPYAQINLLNHLRESENLKLETRHYSWDPQRWLEALAQPGQLLVITFYWAARPAPLSNLLKTWKHPCITYGISDDDLTNVNGVIITGHTMLLAAHDPQHLTRSGKVRPWGFINSWINGGKFLFWMGDEDLRFPRQAVIVEIPLP